MHGFIAIAHLQNVLGKYYHSARKRPKLRDACTLCTLCRFPGNYWIFQFCPRYLYNFPLNMQKVHKVHYAMPCIPRRNSPRQDLNTPDCAVAALDAIVRHNASAKSGDPTPRLRISSLLSAFILPDEVKL